MRCGVAARVLGPHGAGDDGSRNGGIKLVLVEPGLSRRRHGGRGHGRILVGPQRVLRLADLDDPPVQR